jgi:phosphoenolpyruvate-protein kinase (PTS system EI component)
MRTGAAAARVANRFNPVTWSTHTDIAHPRSRSHSTLRSQCSIHCAERRGRPICLCGEAATDPGQLEDLLSAGLRAISVPPPHLVTVHQVIGAHGA